MMPPILAIVAITVIGCFWHLSGVRIDVTSSDGEDVYIVII